MIVFRFAAEIRPEQPTTLVYNDLGPGVINWYDELIDVADNFNPSTGVFTVGDKDDDSGSYVFLFSARRTEPGSRSYLDQIYIQKNGLDVYHSTDNSDNETEINGMVTVNLEKGDEIQLKIGQKYTTFFVANDTPLSFMGYKI